MSNNPTIRAKSRWKRRGLRSTRLPKLASLILILFGIVSLSSSLVWSQEKKESNGLKEAAAPAPQPPSILLYPGTKGAGKGLVVEIVEPVTVPAGGKTEFSYRITNLLEQEVFVEMPSPGDRTGYHYQGPEGVWGRGGNSFIAFPDNVNLLKRLHSSIYTNGDRFTCGCATVTAKATADLPEGATAKGKATVTLWIRGFYRSNGKAFGESIELPLPLKDK